MEHLPKDCEAIDMWQDAGNHFRACELMYYQLGDIFDEHGEVNDVVVNTDPEHHGKAACDAHFGVLNHWKNMYAAEHVIADYLELAEAYRNGAKMSHAFDPPPKGARHHVHVVDMASRPPKLRQVDNTKMDGLLISNTYCLKASRVSKASSQRTHNCLTDIRVQDFVFSDEATALRSWPLFFTDSHKGDADWKVYRAPKSARDMNYKTVIPKLKSRFDKQRRCERPELETGRQRSDRATEVAYEDAMARKRAKQKRVETSWQNAAKKKSVAQSS